MVRRRLATVLVLTALSFGAASTKAGEPDSTKFRIQDYIPERFTDFQWRLDGQASTSSKEFEPLRIYPDQQNNSRRVDLDETSDDQFGFTNSFRYRFETRQVLFDCTFGFTTDLQHTNSETLDSVFSTSGSRLTLYSEHPETTTFFKSPLAGELHRYILSNAFFAAEGSFTYWYSHKIHTDILSTHTVEPDSVSGWYRIQDRHTEMRTREIGRRIDLAGEIRLGWGRFYEGQYAATALYAIERLVDDALLMRQPSRMEMLQLTNLIHVYREGHGHDKRDYRTRALKSVMEYLNAAGLIEEESAEALLSIEDVLDYYPIRERRFGWAVQAGFGGEDEYYNNQSDQVGRSWETFSRVRPDSSWIADTTKATHSHSVSSKRSRRFTPEDHLVARCDLYHPVAVHWQLDIAGTALLYLTRDDPPDNVKLRPGVRYNNTVDRREYTATGTLFYLHDARTELSISCMYTRSQWTRREHRIVLAPSLGSQQDLATDNDGHEWKLQGKLGAAYRLSPSSTFIFGCTYGKRLYLFDHITYEQREDNRDLELSAGITHWLY